METASVKVLLVEDNPDDSRLMHLLLSESAPTQFQITHVVRLSDALTRLHEERFDVVLCDLSLPDSQGFETFQWLNAHAQDKPIIVLSGLDDETLAVKAVREGAQDYLVKGRVDHHILSRAITYAIERHGAEQALEESERHYKFLLESITDYSYTVKLDNGRPVRSSHGPGCVAVTGHSPEEYEADPDLWYRMVHEDDRPAVLEQVKKVLAGETPPPLEHRILHKNRQIRWVRNTIVACRDRQGKLVAYDGLIADITERKRAEERLVTSEAFYHSLVENLPQNICRKDLNFRFTFANKRCCAMLGKPLEEIIGKTDFDLFPPDLAEKYRKDDQSVIETGRVFETVEENLSPEGDKVYVDVVKTPIYGSNGRVIGIQAIFWDIISERKRAEEQLRNSEALYHSLVENLPQNIFRKDLNERFTFANHRFCELLGKPLEEIMGKTDWDFYPPELVAKYQKDDRHVIETGEILETVEENLTPSGEKIYVNVVKTPIYDAKEKIIGTQCIFWDITEQKRAQEQLQKANEELARSEAELRRSHEELKSAQAQLIQAEKMESIGTLAAGVAHEVKNPLAILMMGINYLTKRVAANDENAAQVLKEMREAIDRADSITRGLLDFSASRQLAVKPEDFNGLVDETLRLVRHELNKNEIVLVKDWDRRLPNVAVDKRQIQQVFVNIFMNAIHAMPRGGTLKVHTYSKQLTETTHFEGSRKADHFWVGDLAVIAEVEDTGSGISEEHLAKIFDPFFTTKPTGVGTGLGLPVSKKIIELHGGNLDVRNVRGGGVRVTIMLKAQRN